MKRRAWSGMEYALLVLYYQDAPTRVLAALLNRSERQIYAMAKNLGVKKSAEYLQSEDACRLRRGDDIGAAYRFKPGQTPWNKGGHHVAGGRSSETRFKPGNRPRNWMPIGSYRVNADGYAERKLTDTGYPPRDWRPVHRLVWEEVHGPIPANHAVVFKAGRRSTNPVDITLDALECISRRELMARNTVHNLPKALVEIVRLRASLVRKINARRKTNE